MIQHCRKTSHSGTKENRLVIQIQKALWKSFIYEELKDIFENNKQGFDGKSRTLTHFVAIEQHVAAKAILNVSQNRRELSC